MIVFHSNNVHPRVINGEITNLLVKSGKLFGELIYFKDESTGEEGVKNDEGYCEISWDKVEAWISMKDLKEDLLQYCDGAVQESKRNTKKNTPVKQNKPIIISEKENSTYKIAIIHHKNFYDINDEKLIHTFLFFENVNVLDKGKCSWEDDIEYSFRVFLEKEDSTILRQNRKRIGEPSSIGYIDYLISDTLSKEEMHDKLIKYAVQTELNHISFNENEIEKHRTNISEISQI